MNKRLFVMMLVILGAGCIWEKHSKGVETVHRRSSAEKHLSIYKPWLEKLQRGESIADFIVNKGYKSVAIYGLGKPGVSLINELRNSGVEIAYIIDQRAEEIFFKDIDVYPFSDNLPDVGAVIITTVNDQSELKEKIGSRMKCDVYTLEELVTS